MFEFLIGFFGFAGLVIITMCLGAMLGIFFVTDMITKVILICKEDILLMVQEYINSNITTQVETINFFTDRIKKLNASIKGGRNK